MCREEADCSGRWERLSDPMRPHQLPSQMRTNSWRMEGARRKPQERLSVLLHVLSAPKLRWEGWRTFGPKVPSSYLLGTCWLQLALGIDVFL